jgi:hypothetical protein
VVCGGTGDTVERELNYVDIDDMSDKFYRAINGWQAMVSEFMKVIKPQQINEGTVFHALAYLLGFYTHSGLATFAGVTNSVYIKNSTPKN